MNRLFRLTGGKKPFKYTVYYQVMMLFSNISKNMEKAPLSQLMIPNPDAIE